jgi:hypothetical protein
LPLPALNMIVRNLTNCPLGDPGDVRRKSRSAAQRRYPTPQRCVSARTMAAAVLQLKAREK